MKLKVFLGFLAVVVVLFLLIIVKGSVKPQDSSPKTQVTTSFYPLYFFTSQIGGDLVDVVNITPDGAEPHDYEPTPQDIIKIQNSKLLVLLGKLEPWGQKIKDQLAGKNTSVVEVGNNLADPHIWLSPPLAKEIVEKIADSLADADTKNASVYQKNAFELNIDLDKLDSDFKNGLKNCQSSDIVTAHEAFGHLASTYGLRQMPIAGLTPEDEPSLQQLAEISNFARDNNVKYIFFESLVSPKLADTIAKEVGAQTLVLNPIEGLSEEDLSLGKNYFTEMEKNLANLRLALQCQ